MPKERKYTVEESVVGSMKEIKEMLAGIKPKRTWDEIMPELERLSAEIEAEETGKSIEIGIHRHGALH